MDTSRPEIGVERSQIEKIAAFGAGFRQRFLWFEWDEKGREGRLSLNLGNGNHREQDYRREQDKPISHGYLQWFGRAFCYQSSQGFDLLGSDL